MTEISNFNSVTPYLAGATSRVAVGRYTVHVHPEHGAIVQITPPGQPALPQLRLQNEEGPSLFPEPAPAPTGPRERSPLALLPNEEKHLLASLAAMGGGPVGVSHLLAVAGVPDPERALTALVRDGLVQGDGIRYSLTGNLARELPVSWELKDWRNRALEHFLAWSEAHPSQAAEETSAMCCLLEHASRSGLHAEALRLGRAFEGGLFLSGRWKSWAETLERVRGSARALGDRGTEAWALHQLGTRAFCLDDRTTANDRLTEALEIRDAIGDRAGAAVTFHNMGLLLGPKALAKTVEEPKRGLPHLVFWLLLPAMVLVLGAMFLSRAFDSTDGPLPEPAEEVTSETSGEPAPPAVLEDLDTGEETPPVSEPPLTTQEPVVSDVEVSGEPAEEPEAQPSAPGLDLLPHRLDFGEVPAGTPSEALVVIISNPGDAPLPIDSIAVRGEHAGDFTRDDRCDGVEIGPGNECRFEVVFTPDGGGHRRARLVVTSRATGVTRRVEMEGEGVE